MAVERKKTMSMTAIAVTCCPACGNQLDEVRHFDPARDAMGPLICAACVRRLADERDKVYGALRERWPHLPAEVGA